MNGNTTNKQGGKHTAPIRLLSLKRARFLRGCLPGFIIADFVSTATDRQVREVCRRKRITLPADIAFTPDSQS